MWIARGTLTTLVVLLAFWVLVSCGPDDKEIGDGPDNTTTARPPSSASARPAERTPITEPLDIAEAAATGIDGLSIRTHLSRLTGASTAPIPSGKTTISERGSEKGRRAAAEYMRKSFEEAGITARILEFTSGGKRGYNVEATLKGTEDGEHLWLTAHIDSVGNAGANDNASGLVLILSTAEALKRLDLEHTIHFVAYDLEEIGLLGSHNYMDTVVNSIREREGEEAIIGNINSDMIGYEPDEFNAWVGTCDQAGPIDEAILQASETIDSPIELREVCLGRSDHQSFWDAGLPAVVLTDGMLYDGYPWYHQPGDTMDKLNIIYLRSMIRLTAAAAALLTAPEGAS
jgi:hypothetical protein